MPPIGEGDSKAAIVEGELIPPRPNTASKHFACVDNGCAAPLAPPHLWGQPLPLLVPVLLQLHHPVRYLATCLLDQVGDRAQLARVLLGEESDGLAWGTLDYTGDCHQDVETPIG